jgi:hypothetical protein
MRLFARPVQLRFPLRGATRYVGLDVHPLAKRSKLVPSVPAA